MNSLKPLDASNLRLAFATVLNLRLGEQSVVPNDLEIELIQKICSYILENREKVWLISFFEDESGCSGCDGNTKILIALSEDKPTIQNGYNPLWDNYDPFVIHPDSSIFCRLATNSNTSCCGGWGIVEFAWLREYLGDGIDNEDEYEKREEIDWDPFEDWAPYGSDLSEIDELHYEWLKEYCIDGKKNEYGPIFYYELL